MSTWQLSLRQQPALRLDLRSVSPEALAELSAAQVEQVPLPLGNTTSPLGEWFRVAPLVSDSLDLLLEGDLSRVDRIGWQLGQGRVRVAGSAGDYLGACMRGGDLLVTGSAGDLAACEMAGGRLEIGGNAGDFVASTLPGSMDGMRGGTLVVRGSVGQRCADRMRRGTLVIHGDAGDFLASRLVAGSIALAGRCGAHPAWGMRRGSLVFAQGDAAQQPMPGSTFVPAGAEAAVFWQLLSRDLAQHGGAFATLPQRSIARWLGDLAVDGRGEIILPA
jgi:formylmethanofuran dehydrogenase subunit C